MITKTTKITHGEPVTVTLLANKCDCDDRAREGRVLAIDFSSLELPIMHLEVSHAFGDPYFNRKDLRRFIKKLQEIDAMWDVATVQEG